MLPDERSELCGQLEADRFQMYPVGISIGAKRDDNSYEPWPWLAPPAEGSQGRSFCQVI